MAIFTVRIALNKMLSVMQFITRQSLGHFSCSYVME